MKEKFIILRNPDAPKSARPGAPLAGAKRGKPIKIAIDVENLNLKKVRDLQSKSEVLSVTPAMPMKLIKPFTGQMPANGTKAITAWGIEAVGAHLSTLTGEGIKVAVLDTGINASHPAFKGVKLVQKDFTGEGNADVEGHGTHCAGTIFGRNVNNIRIGVAPGIREALIGKVLGNNGGGSDIIASAINWAMENGAHVISMSLGIDFPGYVAWLQSDGMPAELATSKGLEAYRQNVILFEQLAGFVRNLGAFRQPSVLVAAAGNESMRDQDPDYVIAVSPPAVAEGFISVAALAKKTGGWVPASFSNTGAMVSGPGVDIISADLKTGLTSMSGTSMATPHVAGVAALWAQKLLKRGAFTPQQLVASIIGSGTITGMKKGYDPNAIGSGMVQAPKS